MKSRHLSKVHLVDLVKVESDPFLGTNHLLIAPLTFQAQTLEFQCTDSFEDSGVNELFLANERKSVRKRFKDDIKVRPFACFPGCIC